MKKLLTAVMVFAGSAAFAQIDATEVGPELKEETREVGQNARELGKQAGMATEDQGTFKSKKAFSLKGDLKEGGKGEITVARQGLPDAVLDIRDQTQVMIDGKKAKADDLQDGMKVDAKFQLEGEETVAVMIKAKTQARKQDKAMGGAGEAGKKEEDKAAKDAKDDDALMDATEVGEDARENTRDIFNEGRTQ